MKTIYLIIPYLFIQYIKAQHTGLAFATDKKTGCRVVSSGGSDRDSVSWEGPCKKKLAEGNGILKWYENGSEISRYTGYMHEGLPNGQGLYKYRNGHTAEGNFLNGELNGQGIYRMSQDRSLKGNFVNGKFLELDSPYLRRLQKHVVSGQDSTNLYIGDGINREMFYYILAPEKATAVIVLLPGTWESPEYVLSSNRKLVQMAFEEHMAVMVLSLNQRLILNRDILDFMNLSFNDAIKRYALPRDKFVIGGFSMGGMMSLRYTEMAHEDSAKTAIVPRCVYSVDGPADLESLYRNFQKKLDKNPQAGEPAYGLNEFRKHIGGSPEEFHDRYITCSPFSRDEKNGGNARFLTKVPVRIYTDVDPNWWLDYRQVDMYDLNGLDQSAMILFLLEHGNKKAEFINASGKGYRLEGNRHPHSWSIVDAEDCIRWIKACMSD